MRFVSSAVLVAFVAGTGTAEAAGQFPTPPAWEIEAPAAADPIFLLTMGPDHDEVFREWGHAALCVGERCFNYGVTDFSRPVGLLVDVLRGDALFWVAVTPYERTVATYFGHDRSVFRQDLDLTPEARSALLGKLAADLVPGASEYLYNHFEDNCTTRIRDYLDEASGGALRDAAAGFPPSVGRGGGPGSFRTQIRRGLTERPLFLWASDVGVGSAVDQPISGFQTMFLPEALRAGVEAAFDAPPRQLRSGRDGDTLPGDPGSGGYVPALLLVAGGLALLVLRGGRLRRLATGVSVAALTLLGTIGLFLVVVSPLPEFHSSLLFAAVPVTDALLGTRLRRWYAPLRLAFGLGFLAALLIGFFPQPLEWMLFAALLPVAAIWWRDRRPRDPGAEGGSRTDRP